MIIAHVLVFFILISSEPTKPGPHAYGSQATWALYGAPSEQKAREWAQAQFHKTYANGPTPQTIKEFLVVPMSDTLYTDTGSEPVPWTSLPSPEERAITSPSQSQGITSDDPSTESEIVMMPQNKGLKMSGVQKEMTPDEIRASLIKQNANSADWNWDEAKAWYFIYCTKKQAVLVKSVNSIAAGIPYARAVQGTPAADESARIEIWEGLSKYSE